MWKEGSSGKLSMNKKAVKIKTMSILLFIKI